MCDERAAKRQCVCPGQKSLMRCKPLTQAVFEMSFTCDFLDMTSDELVALVLTKHGPDVLRRRVTFPYCTLQQPLRAGAENFQQGITGPYNVTDCNLEVFCGCLPNSFAVGTCRFQHVQNWFVDDDGNEVSLGSLLHETFPRVSLEQMLMYEKRDNFLAIPIVWYLAEIFDKINQAKFCESLLMAEDKYKQADFFCKTPEECLSVLQYFHPIVSANRETMRRQSSKCITPAEQLVFGSVYFCAGQRLVNPQLSSFCYIKGFVTKYRLVETLPIKIILSTFSLLWMVMLPGITLIHYTKGKCVVRVFDIIDEVPLLTYQLKLTVEDTNEYFEVVISNAFEFNYWFKLFYPPNPK